MKKLMVVLVLTLFNITVYASVYVHGYTRSNGTYVAPYYRSSPNNSVYDNWSTKGNINPYTGQEGTKYPYNNTYYDPVSYPGYSNSAQQYPYTTTNTSNIYPQNNSQYNQSSDPPYNTVNNPIMTPQINISCPLYTYPSVVTQTYGNANILYGVQCLPVRSN